MFKTALVVVAISLLSLITTNFAAIPVPPGYYIGQTVTNYKAAVQLFLPLNSILPTKGLIAVSVMGDSIFNWVEICTTFVNVTWSGQAVAADRDLNIVAVTSFNLDSPNANNGIVSFIGPFPDKSNLLPNETVPVCVDDAFYQFDSSELIGPITASALSNNDNLMIVAHSNSTLALMNVYDISTAFNLTLVAQIPFNNASALIGHPYVTSLTLSSDPFFLFSRQVIMSLTDTTQGIEVIGYLDPRNTTAGFTTISIALTTANSLEEMNKGVGMAVSPTANMLTVITPHAQDSFRIWVNSNPGAPGSKWRLL